MNLNSIFAKSLIMEGRKMIHAGQEKIYQNNKSENQ